MPRAAARPLTTMALAGGLLPAAAEARALTTPFEANRGQTDPRVEFVARTAGLTLFLAPGEASFAVTPASGRPTPARVRMTLAGSRARAGTGRDPWPGRVHYLRGRDPSQWVRGVPLFGRVEYAEVYPGVSLVYHVDRGRLEYDFVIGPGADPGRIKLRFEGATSVRLEAAGELVIETTAGAFVQRAPALYQEANGTRREVSGRLVRRGRTLGFETGPYDRSRPLVIDPVFERVSYLGGDQDETFPELAVDAAGKAYVVGTTTSPDFPVSPSAAQDVCRPTVSCKDVFVAKIDPAATGPAALVWATYLGGNDLESAFAIAADAGGHAYVVGKTSSVDFPTTPGSFQPSCQPSPSNNCSAGFVAKLASDGSGLVYSSYVSGGHNVENGTAAFDEAQGVTVDAEGRAYVTGSTASRHFPVTAGAFQTTFGGSRDAFLLKLDPQGSAAVYSTYLGGIGTEDYVKVVVDAGGNAYLGGRTDSPNFPTRAPIRAYSGLGDGFIAKLNPSGTDLVYSTYFGGGNVDSCIGIAVDPSGSVSVTGQTKSPDLPLVNPVEGPSADIETYGDAFVAKLNTAGSGLTFSTYLGIAGYGTDVAADLEGNTYVSGSFYPIDFATKFRPDGSLAFASLLAPSLGAFPAIEVGAAGRILLASDTMADLATVAPFQPARAGGADAYFLVIDPFPERGLAYYTLAPCRTVDTRRAPDALGGPALEAGIDREFSLVGTCGVPPGARAVSANVTVTAPSALGNLRLYPADAALPPTSTVNYTAGQTRANNTVAPLSATGRLAARATQASGTTHFILDVNGYFAPPADLVIEIRGNQGPQAFTPSPVWVSTGQTVAWYNADSVAHTATADGGAFDTGFIGPGLTSARVLMTSSGVFPYHCTFHPGMAGRLDVH